ncbi:MAG: septum formation initiator family protein [Candidatus Wallbacteria bacterium]|nr:septum formation initiator family protein [Candidatus Wallbacteria bacterium]
MIMKFKDFSLTPGKSPQESRKIRIVLTQKIIVLFGIIFILAVCILFKNRFDEIKANQAMVQKKIEENQVLREKIIELEKKIAEIKTDEGVERLAREKLKLIKKGEKVIRIVDQKEKVPDGSGTN